MDLIIREAKVQDIGFISEICSIELDYVCNKETVKKQLEKLDKKHECVYVAEINDIVVGFIQFEVLNVIYADTMINVVALAVDKQYKGKGIGKKLLKAAEHWGMSIGINYVRLNSSMNREGAHKFYLKQGYENDKVQLRFLKKLSL